MSKENLDIWSKWLLERRFGGDRDAMEDALTNFLFPWRDNILDHAQLMDQDILLDVGCGDGLIAFGALERIESAHVIFSDISQDLLDHSKSLANEMKVLDRCQFVRASADDLSVMDGASVDVVTTRSVLIYVPSKIQAFREFFRVLKPNGRLSIFEPINRFAFPEPSNRFDGYDVSPFVESADKVKSVYQNIQSDSDPMLDFDERDLFSLAEDVGFTEIQLEYHAEIRPKKETINWSSYLRQAANPKIPSLEEAMDQALTKNESEQFMAYLRPLVEAKEGIRKSAYAYLWAIK